LFLCSGTKWEAQFLTNVKDNAPPDVEVLRFSSLTLESELENNTNSVLPFFTLNVGIMIAFCVVTWCPFHEAKISAENFSDKLLYFGHNFIKNIYICKNYLCMTFLDLMSLPKVAQKNIFINCV
jgi:hypothetical protein